MSEKTSKNQKTPLKSTKKACGKLRNKIFFGVGICGLIGGLACALVGLLTPREMLPDLVFPEVPSKKADNNIYSNLTGLAVSSETEVKAPAYCIQTPNGMDGARPQAGLNQAGVVFEAIAEAGITRFAAIYQNPTSAVIGPIRSLRLYYLEWDTPFDCTIVHAGGAPDALAAVARGYKDLTEDYSYMYRGSVAARRWNNLFTTAGLLAQMNDNRGYGGAEINGFSRLTPEESLAARVDAGATKLAITEPATGNTSEVKAAVNSVAVDFGGLVNFNVRYNYDADSNSYLRSYESGAAHEVYACPGEDLGEKNPEAVCQLQQLAPSVVVAMEVSEHRASDDYHEDITTIGSGKAWVFQNGQAITGTWSKSSIKDQIKFFDASGVEIKLAPGQTFVEAVPAYGDVTYN